VRLLSYSDFERKFGGLSADSEMSYAVRQFFLNGGSEAWVVRLARTRHCLAHSSERYAVRRPQDHGAG